MVSLFALFIFTHKSLSSANSCVSVDNIEQNKIEADTLSFKTNGNIVFIPYSKGDYIKKGQVIARLDGLTCQVKKNNVCDCIILAPYNCYIVEKYHFRDDYIEANTPIVAISSTNYCSPQSAQAPKNPSD